MLPQLITFEPVLRYRQEAEDYTSYVGRTPRQKYLATPHVGGVAVADLANGPQGHWRPLIGAGKPIFLARIVLCADAELAGRWLLSFLPPIPHLSEGWYCWIADDDAAYIQANGELWPLDCAVAAVGSKEK